MTGNGNGDHAQFRDDVAPWLLGALADAEREAFERHLAACGRCREEVAVLRPAVEALPVSAPPVAPPPELRDRIMRLVRSEAQLLQAAGDDADRPERRERRRRPVLGSLRPALAVAAAAAVLVAGAVGYVIGNGGSGGGGERVVAAKVTFPSARASVRTQDGRASLQLANMPAPTRGRVYQVWLKRNGEMPRPTRALFVVRSGAVVIPGGIRDADQVMVTAEPPGGSQLPTSQPVIVANTA